VTERKPLTRLQFAKLALEQEGKCAKCKERLDFVKPRQIVDEHLHPLADGGGNEMDNRALYCVTCAKGKTVKEATPRARSKRYAEGRTQFDKRKAAGGSRIKSRGFDKTYRKKMDGTVERRND
jgi:5-methylcytosine-specific restriction endonuclease McrA